MLIERPTFVTVPLKDGLRWAGGGGWRYEEKMDGVWHVKEIQGAVLVGELMKSGEFYAFDMVELMDEDIRHLPLRTRLQYLDRGYSRLGQNAFLRPASGHGAEFLEAVLARGGEGVVAKELDAPFGSEWFKCKRIITLDLIVTEKALDGRSSIRLSELNGEDRGWCPCRAEYDNICVGEIVEVAAYGLTSKGKLREPRFVKRRPDKCS